MSSIHKQDKDIKVNIEVMPTEMPNNFQLRNEDNSVQQYKRLQLAMLMIKLKKEIEKQKCETINTNDPSVIIRECIKQMDINSMILKENNFTVEYGTVTASNHFTQSNSYTISDDFDSTDGVSSSSTQYFNAPRISPVHDGSVEFDLNHINRF